MLAAFKDDAPGQISSRKAFHHVGKGLRVEEQYWMVRAGFVRWSKLASVLSRVDSQNVFL